MTASTSKIALSSILIPLRCWNIAFILGILASIACGDNVGAGLNLANDLMYQRKYAQADQLYRKLLVQLETNPPPMQLS